MKKEIIVRQCAACGREFKSRRKNQVLCGRLECKKAYWRKRMALKKPKVTTDATGDGCAVMPIKPKRGKIITSRAVPLPPDFGKVTITVDFGKYPAIYERLCTLSVEEFRTPEMQMLKLLNEELEKREAA